MCLGAGIFFWFFWFFCSVWWLPAFLRDSRDCCVAFTLAFVQHSCAYPLAVRSWYPCDFGVHASRCFAVSQNVADGTIAASLLTFLILFNNLVPISLYVSLDMIKVAQAKAMERDPAMMYTTDDGEKKWAKVHTSRERALPVNVWVCACTHTAHSAPWSSGRDWRWCCAGAHVGPK